jgi:hypothetical protein
MADQDGWPEAGVLLLVVVMVSTVFERLVFDALGGASGPGRWVDDYRIEARTL